MEKWAVFLGQKLHKHKMSILAKLICEFNLILVEVRSCFLQTTQAVSKVQMDEQTWKNSQ